MKSETKQLALTLALCLALSLPAQGRSTQSKRRQTSP